MSNIPMEVLIALPKLTAEQLAPMLDKHGIEGELREKLLSRARPTPVKGNESQHSRRRYMLVMWLLSASFRQLSYEFEIAHQTVLNYVDKLMHSEERRQLRIAGFMSSEHYWLFRQNYRKNEEYLATLPPAEAAKWLYDNTDKEL